MQAATPPALQPAQRQLVRRTHASARMHRRAFRSQRCAAHVDHRRAPARTQPRIFPHLPCGPPNAERPARPEPVRSRGALAERSLLLRGTPRDHAQRGLRRDRCVRRPLDLAAGSSDCPLRLPRELELARVERVLIEVHDEPRRLPALLKRRNAKLRPKLKRRAPPRMQRCAEPPRVPLPIVHRPIVQRPRSAGQEVDGLYLMRTTTGGRVQRFAAALTI